MNLSFKDAPKKNRVLFITGGTGSLGQEIVNQLLTSQEIIQNRRGFNKIIIYSRDEQKQDKMRQKFGDNPYLRFFIGDIRDKDRLEMAMRGVTHVIHAAAMKIVPSIEYNPHECIKTNVIGAQNLIEVCAANNFTVEKVLAISTDKAVYPINLYGASKLAAEKLFMDANNICPGVKFSVARYGNVTNSNGSVIPYFKNLIDENRPLPITDLRMSRFWITLENAAKFVIDRLEDSQGAEILIPEMNSYKIEDLAYALLDDKFGLDIPEQYGMRIVGIRAGEKLHEDLVTSYEFEYIYDKPGYYIITKQHNKEYAKTLEDARLSGLAVKNSYNSSMFLMTRDELKEKLIDCGVIEIPFENIKEDEQIGAN